MPFSKSQEDYLKIIWYLERDQIKATSSVVAERYEVKPPTVLAMFKQLAHMKLLTYDKNRGARLTEQGERAARKLVRKHRLIETFLEKVLEMDEQLVHDEAEHLEHVVSDQLMYRIDKYLGFPDRDPHGTDIPTWHQQLKFVSLGQIKIMQSFQIKSIDLEPETARFYHDKKFVRGSTWTLHEKTPDDTVYTFTNGHSFLSLAGSSLDKIQVIPFD
jgi:DtxR family Mn-dependent transcriptional regulator